MPLITTPFQYTGGKDKSTHVAFDMALAHICNILATNSMYVQTPHISVSKYRTFVNYYITLYDGLNAHHHNEGEIVLLEIEKWRRE